MIGVSEIDFPAADWCTLSEGEKHGEDGIAAAVPRSRRHDRGILDAVGAVRTICCPPEHEGPQWISVGDATTTVEFA